jgi:hypothetical protein
MSSCFQSLHGKLFREALRTWRYFDRAIKRQTKICSALSQISISDSPTVIKALRDI